MQLETLKIFCDVARLRSFSRGAAENGVTQSTASQAVQQLEDHFGVQLIERSCRPLELTSRGRAIYEQCREIVERYLELEHRFRRDGAKWSRQVHVAAIYSVGLGDMSQLVQEFARRYAPAEAHVEYVHPDQVYQRVLDDAVDLGIVSFPRKSREWVVVPWREEEMAIVCHPRRGLAQQERASPSALEGEPFVGFDEGLTIRRETDRFLRQHGVTVKVVMTFDNVEAIKRAVEVDSGVAILPRPTVMREAAAGTLRVVRFARASFVRPLGIIYRRGKRLFPCTQQFIELLRQYPSGNGSGGKEFHHASISA
ncbi:MAG: LysR family transcriptional regulator [Verrucomicrobiae bacterium]|nr:LysR family transcriptional regulator [Verrucomicrobiae bacterium]